jgi:hypothetical protein
MRTKKHNLGLNGHKSGVPSGTISELNQEGLPKELPASQAVLLQQTVVQ